MKVVKVYHIGYIKCYSNKIYSKMYNIHSSIEYWDTSKVTDMSYMFSCSQVFDPPKESIFNKDIRTKNINENTYFQGYAWDVSSVTIFIIHFNIQRYLTKI